MKKLSALLFLCFSILAFSQDYNGTTVPKLNDSERDSLHKINRVLHGSPSTIARKDSVGTTFGALPPAPARAITIVNNTGADVWVQYAGQVAEDYIVLPDKSGYTFKGLTNASGLLVKVASGTATVRYVIEN